MNSKYYEPRFIKNSKNNIELLFSEEESKQTLLDLSNFMQLILGGIVGLMMYVLITKFVMKMDLYDQIFDLIKNKIK